MFLQNRVEVYYFFLYSVQLKERPGVMHFNLI